MVNDVPSSTPLCRVQDSQLVVVDIQQRLGAAMPNKVLNRVVLNTVLLARAAGILGVPRLLTEQYPRGLGPTDPTVHGALGDVKPFEKTAFSAARADGFMDALANNDRKQVVLVGMESHVCVLQTALELSDAGYRVFVVEDAVCSRRLENYQNALDRMRQTDTIIVSAESVVFEWLTDAGHQHFKEIQALLR